MARGVLFSPRAWDEYLHWLGNDRTTFSKINELIKECQREPFQGKGKPELLKNDLTGWWSRRITDEHRLVYRPKDTHLEIAQCRYHYSK